MRTKSGIEIALDVASHVFGMLVPAPLVTAALLFKLAELYEGPLMDTTAAAELQKLAGQFSESARVAVRNVRRDGMDLLKRLEKAHEMSEDQAKARSNDVQKITDKHIQLIDEALKHKSEEIMQV